MEQELDVVERPWDKLEDEPPEWYRIFSEYYLPLGERRSIRNAFEFYIRVEQPPQYKELDPNNLTHVPQHWAVYAAQFEWARRALAFDESKIPDLDQAYVAQVLSYLRGNALNAAASLVQALRNDRTRVQAANSILNRVGVPETSVIDVKTGITITTDDMNEASSRVEAWKQTKKLSG